MEFCQSIKEADFQESMLGAPEFCKSTYPDFLESMRDGKETVSHPEFFESIKEGEISALNGVTHNENEKGDHHESITAKKNEWAR